MGTATCTSYHLVYSVIKPFEMTSLLLNSRLLYGLINVNVVLIQEIQLGTTPVNTYLVIWSLLRATQALIQAWVRSVCTWMQSLIDLFSFTVHMTWCDNAPSSPVGWGWSLISCLLAISLDSPILHFLFLHDSPAQTSILFHVSPLFVFMFDTIFFAFII